MRNRIIGTLTPRRRRTPLVRQAVMEAKRLQHMKAQGEVMSSHMVIETPYGWTVRAYHPEAKVETDTVLTRKARKLQRKREIVERQERKRDQFEKRVHNADLARLGRYRERALEMEARWGEHI